MWDPYRQKTQCTIGIAGLSCWISVVLAIIATHALAVSAEIKFIPVNRLQNVRDNILEESVAHSNKVDRPHEPLALESSIVATVHLSPSSSSSSSSSSWTKDNNGTRVDVDEDKPNINANPVLQFHTAQEQEKDESDYDDESEESEEENDAKEETGISAAVDQLLKSDLLLANKKETDADSDVQNLTPTTRHRRRLMLLRSRNILVPETSTSTSRTTSSTTSSSRSSSSSSSPRPPKEHIIYALPEQGFWAKSKSGGGRNKGAGGGKNSIPATLHLDEDATPTSTTETPLSSSTSTSTFGENVTKEDENAGVKFADDFGDQLNDQRQRQNAYVDSTPPQTPQTPPTSTVANFYQHHLGQNLYQAPPAQFNSFSSFPTLGGDSSVNFQQFLTTPSPPPTTLSTSTSTTTSTTQPPTTSTSTSIPSSPTPSPAETLRMTLAEKKFHLGQCMRYCMDAIL